jgi:hypothetical protein
MLRVQALCSFWRLNDFQKEEGRILLKRLLMFGHLALSFTNFLQAKILLMEIHSNKYSNQFAKGTLKTSKFQSKP